jgi:hypothetical protein
MRRLIVLGARPAAIIRSRKAWTSATETVKSRMASSGQRRPMAATKAMTSWR